MGNFIGDNINAIRVHYGLSQEQFAERINASQTSVSSWEVGASIPRKSKVTQIMNAFGVSFDDVMSEDNGFSSSVFSEHGREGDYVEVPLYGSIAAGEPIEMVAYDNKYPVPSKIRAKYPKGFLLKVDGESMNRVLPNGCYAYIDPAKTVDVPMKPYAVCVNGYDATIKRVRALNNGFELVPDSNDPTYKPTVYDYGVDDTPEITVIGRVVWYCVPMDWEF